MAAQMREVNVRSRCRRVARYFLSSIGRAHFTLAIIWPLSPFINDAARETRADLIRAASVQSLSIPRTTPALFACQGEITRPVVAADFRNRLAAAKREHAQATQAKGKRF